MRSAGVIAHYLVNGSDNSSAQFNFVKMNALPNLVKPAEGVRAIS